MPIFRANSSSLPLTLYFIWWMISIATRTLSIIEWPSTKANNFLEIHLGRIDFNLLANTLETILYNALHNEIGLKSFKDEELSIFGVRTMFVLFSLEGKKNLASTKPHHYEQYHHQADPKISWISRIVTIWDRRFIRIHLEDNGNLNFLLFLNKYIDLDYFLR